MEQLVNAVVNGLVGVVVVLIGLAFSGVREYIVKKAGQLRASKKADELAIITSLAATAVTAVEQMYKDVKGEDKLAEALDLLLASASKYGITITKEQARPAIEAAVHEMNETRNVIKKELTAAN